MSIYSFIGKNNATTTEYHTQANEQVERNNNSLTTRLRHYVDEHQTNWDEFVQPLTNTCKMQAHKSTGETPFILVLSRHPKNPAVTAETPPPFDLDQTNRKQRQHLESTLWTQF